MLTLAGNKTTMPISKTFLPRYVQAATGECTIKLDYAQERIPLKDGPSSRLLGQLWIEGSKQRPT